MPAANGGPQEDPSWNEPEEEAKSLPKYSFLNLDVRLYRALLTLAKEYKGIADSGDGGSWRAEDQPEYIQAVAILEEFKAQIPPLPEWASDLNTEMGLVTNAQLLTRDGRKHGNARITGSYLSNQTYYIIQTEAGNVMTFSEKEVHNGFWIGDYILKELP
jgi:hypothetical protein